MLFNSPQFIFLFLPVVYVLFLLVRNISKSSAILTLLIGSIVFYSWWDPIYIPLLTGSILVNYISGRLIGRFRETSLVFARVVFLLSLVANLGCLLYFKYFVFLASNMANMLGVNYEPLNIILPLGISFFTFTQIAFLIDIFNGKCKEPRFLTYALFVTFFPHLIAGPILHHQEMVPQFENMKFDWQDITAGIVIFVIGLTKKVLLADTFAPISDAFFDEAAVGQFTAAEAWVGSIAYTLQLYFDFSGYSDMAIGLSLMFGIRLPINFNSPYKATSIIEFWRRWHITLSRFLRDYLYIPLGGNKKGPVRRYINVFVTMLLGGIWHGANWTFVFWGAYHGLLLALNHLWRDVVPRRIRNFIPPILQSGLGWLITLSAVVFGWVLFRASDLETAQRIIGTMVSSASSLSYLAVTNPIPLLQQFVMIFWNEGVSFIMAIMHGTFHAPSATVLLLLGTLLVLLAPNVHEFLACERPTLERLPYSGRLIWIPNVTWALLLSMLCIMSFLFMSKPSSFLYFQF